MPAWGWIPIGLAVVIIALVVLLIMRRRNTNALRQQFGGEYDRAVAESGNRRSGEAHLRSRQQMRAQIVVKPLPEESRAQYAREWRSIQERFVDQPSSAVTAAQELVDTVMQHRGYPVQDFEAQADLVSVDHPDLVENYRIAYDVNQRNKLRRATTEELRDALLRYRSLFDQLLRDDADNSAVPNQTAHNPDRPGAHRDSV